MWFFSSINYKDYLNKILVFPFFRCARDFCVLLDTYFIFHKACEGSTALTVHSPSDNHTRSNLSIQNPNASYPNFFPAPYLEQNNLFNDPSRKPIEYIT